MSAPSHAAGAPPAGPAREERTPADFDITAYMHEVDLPWPKSPSLYPCC